MTIQIQNNIYQEIIKRWSVDGDRYQDVLKIVFDGYKDPELIKELQKACK